jgi:phosphatidylinositol dimannoside acyltransferase
MVTPRAADAQARPVNPTRLQELFADLRHHDSILWRRAIKAGVTYGPDAFVRYSPPLFGLLCSVALADQRRSVLRNLRMALGKRSPAEEYADVARVFSNYANCLTEAFIAGSDRGHRLIAHHVNDENYIEAVDQGRGVIVATAHTGGWQAAGPLLRSVHDADVLVVMQRERDQRAQALQDLARGRAGIRVHTSESPLDALPLLGHLRKKGVVAVQIDRLPSGMRSRAVKMFGQRWLVPEGPLQLAAVSGAPIIPTFTRRLRYMEYEVIAGPAIRLPRRPSADELDAAAQTTISQVESFIRANPTQWFHFE